MSVKGFNDVIRMNEAVSGLASLRWRLSKQMNVNVWQGKTRGRGDRESAPCVWLWYLSECDEWTALYGCRVYLATDQRPDLGISFILIYAWLLLAHGDVRGMSQKLTAKAVSQNLAQSFFFHSSVDVTELPVLLKVWTPQIWWAPKKHIETN